MGPLFSLGLMAIAAGMVFSVVALVFKVFLPARVAVRCAVGFVIGAGAGAALSVGLFGLTIGTGIQLARVEVIAYLAALALGAVSGGAALSWHIVRRFSSC